jgi:hypothetical protein
MNLMNRLKMMNYLHLARKVSCHVFRFTWLFGRFSYLILEMFQRCGYFITAHRQKLLLTYDDNKIMSFASLRWIELIPYFEK